MSASAAAKARLAKVERQYSEQHGTGSGAVSSSSATALSTSRKQLAQSVQALEDLRVRAS